MQIRFYVSLLSLIVLLNQTGNSQNVGINSTGSAPASSAMLDISSTSKGMLIPRVSLSSTTDVTTISSPTTSLLVYNSNASMTNGSVGYWYYNGSAWVKFETTNNNWSLTGNTGTTAGTNYIGTTDAVDFVTKTNASEKMRVTSGGNVGIGTTSPTNILSFGGNSARTIWMERHTTAATAGNSLTVQSGGAYSGGTNLNGGDINISSGTSTGTGTSNVYIKTSTAGASGTVDNAPSTKMTVLGSGNVGINTTTPGSTLDVKGTIRLSGSTSGYVGLAPAAAAGSTTYTLPSADGSNGQALTTNGTGTLSWGTADAGDWHTTGNSGTTAGTNFIGTTDGIDFVTKTNSVEKMRVTSGGNVGIGTASPTNILSLGGNSARTIWMERHTTAATAGNSLTLQSGGAFSGGTNLNGGDLNLSSGTSTGTGTSNIYFKTSTAGASGTADDAPSTKMTVLGSGNVGINITAPTQKLEISSGHVLLSNTNNTADELRFQEPSTSGSSYTAFKAQAQTGNLTYTLPASQSANTVLTNDGSGNLSWATSGSYLYKRKASDESVTSSTTLQDDNDFTFTLTASQTYELTALFKIDCNSTGQFKSQFVAPAGTTLLINIFDNTSGLDDLDWYTAPSSTTTVGSNGISSTSDMVVLQGTVVVAGTGGTFKMQWAQSTSNATATTLYTNSYMKLVRVQ